MAQEFRSYSLDTGQAGASAVRYRSDTPPPWPVAPVQGSIHRLDWPSARTGPPSGVAINANSALTISAYFACVSRISRDIACLPIRVVRERFGRGRSGVPSHPVNRIRWIEMPWPFSGSFAEPARGGSNRVKVVAAAQAHALSRGNGYLRIHRGADGFPEALELLDPTQWLPQRRSADGALYYRGPSISLAPDDLLHVAGLGYDGLQGYSIAQYAADNLGLAKAQDTFKARFYGTGGQPKAVLETPGEIGPDAVASLAASWNDVYGGPENSHKVVILEQGLSLKPFQISYDDTKFLQSQQWSLTEICRWFGLPPNKIGDYSQAQLASAGIEAMNLDYLQSAILQWVVVWEAELTEKLLTADEIAAGLRIRMDFEELLRADTRTRGEYNQRALTSGWETINEVREREGKRGVTLGDEPLVPVNARPLSQAHAWREALKPPGSIEPDQESAEEEADDAHETAG